MEYIPGSHLLPISEDRWGNTPSLRGRRGLVVFSHVPSLLWDDQHDQGSIPARPRISTKGPSLKVRSRIGFSAIGWAPEILDIVTIRVWWTKLEAAWCSKGVSWFIFLFFPFSGYRPELGDPMFSSDTVCVHTLDMYPVLLLTY